MSDGTNVQTKMTQSYSNDYIRLDVSLQLSPRDLLSIDIQMLKQLQRVIQRNEPAHVQLSMFATVFQALGREENIVNK